MKSSNATGTRQQSSSSIQRFRKTVAAILFCGISIAVAHSEPLNILLITADDLGMQLGCYGDSQASTPELDRLAAEGALFSRAYVAQSSCSPSRATLLTGLFPHQHGQVGLAGERPSYRVEERLPNLVGVLRQAGYYTGILGKLHISPPSAFPFHYEWKESLQKPIITRDVRKMAELAGQFLKESEGRPFFLYANYFDPHRPFDAEAHQFEGLPADPVRPNNAPGLDFLGGATTPADAAAYRNCVSRLDTGVGMLLQELREAGLLERTVVIFISDNGPPFARAKTTCYEAGVQVPLLIHWPGVSKAKMRSDALVSGVDIMPTILEAAGVAAPAGLAGESLRSLLAGKSPPEWRERILSEFTSHAAQHFYPRRALRQGRFKIIRNYEAPRRNPVGPLGVSGISGLREQEWVDAFATAAAPPEWELYNLENDPFELHNLATEPGCVGDLQKMKAALEAELAATEDPIRSAEGLQQMRGIHD